MYLKKLKNIRFLFILCLFIILSGMINAYAQSYKLVWSDEFNVEGKPDSTVWIYEKGFVRNNEHQWYQTDNAYCKNGLLIIEARKEKIKNPNYDPSGKDWRKNREYAEYSSALIKTMGKKAFLYGRIEIRAKIPTASGAWPAIWTLGQKSEWPSCGEIDIMEYYRINNVPHLLANAAWGTDTRFQANWNSKRIPFQYFLAKDPQWSSKFHIWRLDWDEKELKISIDDELINEVSVSQAINGQIGQYINPFRQPHYLLLNLAIGGQHGGVPDNSAFPMKYEIDYVRVYQQSAQSASFQPGAIWPDNKGIHINAHGGGILFYNGTYYWFGEYKSEYSNSALVGVNCYSSTDLYNWKNEGVALAVDSNKNSDIVKGCIIERPKVVFNKKTGKFVMWFHLELKGKGYEAARSGVAISDNVTGPYKLIRSERINAGKYPINISKDFHNLNLQDEKYKKWWTPVWKKAIEKGLYVKRDMQKGQMARDMTIFIDDDGKAYHIYSSEDNLTLQLAELTDDYQNHTGKYIRISPGGHNEAPAIFKRKGTYWMITSGCTGWEPNEARMFSANSIWGPWTQHPNPCKGEKGEITFEGQSTYVQQVYGKKDAYIFMADMWRPKHPVDGRYIWLPISFENDKPTIVWSSSWDLNQFENE
ncbi:MAG: family 43 glycosylhydrolase [Paludibacteraceae bacterium]